MAEIAVSLVVDQLLPLLREEAKLLRGVHKEFADIKDELESIQAFLKDADKRAVSAEGEGVKTWVKQVREVAFRIEDIIDDYLILVGQKPRKPGCVDLVCKIKTMIPRRRIVSEIRDIKSSVREIKERSERYGFQRSLERGSSNDKWHDPRVASLYIEEGEVVGYEVQRERLIDWLIKGRDERTVVSVVGMGGQGKTTLAKKVFDSKNVIGHFDCRVWITVSQSYNVEGLLRDMLLKFYKQKGEDPPKDIFQMDRGSLTDEVRNYLQQKRYVIVFDDVWSVHFWDDIEFAIIDNKNGSKIFITTRNLDVVVSCKKSSFIEVLELQPLTQEQSLELFNKKAFRFDYSGCCPKELVSIAYEIVRKCKGLPLAIVTIGGLLSAKEKNVFEWQRFSENLSFELMKDTHLIGIKEILGLSYDDLPYSLKSCLLYFGIYPEDYEVKSKRVIRQWIAEGFVKEERGKTLEEVAEGYLTELVHRSLVQVSSIRIDGKAKGCRVHDLIRDMILEKFEELNFCKHISEDGQSSLSGTVRRLSITTTSDDFIERIESSHVRSILVFTNKTSNTLAKRIPAKCRWLKVLDYESTPLFNIPEKFGNLIHLKYLSLGYITAGKIPNSIGMLQNLETLDLKATSVSELPKGISKLRNLRHLIGSGLSLIQLNNGLGEMTSLQTLCYINLGMDGAAEVIKELGKLKKMRELGLLNVCREDYNVLSSSINEMQHLEKLHVKLSSATNDEFVDLNLISPPTKLRKLTLRGRLQKLPEWILELQNLVVLRLKLSCLTKDPMQSLKSLQHLLILSIGVGAYGGSHLYFQDGWFQKLKELDIGSSDELREIIIDKGTLSSLKKLQLYGLPKLKNIPTGIQHLEKLEVLHIRSMQVEYLQHKSPEDWNWIMEHVPLVEISTSDGNIVPNSRR
ncbi:unnamed protein product [Trifolium pratense]|uniref:Uncharacterized protein n=1 Tax=Trifolium pratense TaxID=57577 RepID=A0ACB0J718_TRIPR|nr:unnamed protein product [Trifolium pratense]